MRTLYASCLVWKCLCFSATYRLHDTHLSEMRTSMVSCTAKSWKVILPRKHSCWSKSSYWCVTMLKLGGIAGGGTCSALAYSPERLLSENRKNPTNPVFYLNELEIRSRGLKNFLVGNRFEQLQPRGIVRILRRRLPRYDIIWKR